MTEPPEPAATLRAFIALAPPDDAKEELAHALRPVYAAHPRLRQNRIEDWHITLAFLGEQPMAAIQRLRQPLGDLAATHPSPELALRGGGHFDDRVLWSGLEGDLDGLHLLSGAVRKQVGACGVAFPERPLRPHLTLARARRHDTTSVPEAAAALDAFTGRRWRSLRLHLVASIPGNASTPRRYEDVAAWELAGGSGEPPKI
ncbi:RNA 2',3'-cyclic phosphodiesterase [Streptomyces endophyticus]|uniref:RNA 2',3'-cyclic phosphodiesterase n=1 Tax=Streptomyces endophyticus TaxID=714166 RepID=A0ABU6FAP5_9ACTN|nr:RNA 2',3'-cyclic phosphodiesterase [Streptomyces endophyticus]MEB8340909.1 RNA 2',3'-cyclic phosphodiesterase [Streptomyces endophyticus]